MSSPESKPLFREAFSVYGLVLSAIIVLAIAATFLPFLSDFLYAAVALLFILVPQRLLEKKNLDPSDFGLVRAQMLKNFLWGLVATVITLPFFAVGYYIWMVEVLEHKLDFSADHYLQWPIEFEGEPKGWGGETGVWIWSAKDRIHLGLRNNNKRNNQVHLQADRPFKVQNRGTIGAVAQELDANGEATHWTLTLSHSRSRGVATIIGPRSLNVAVEPVAEESPRWPLFVGPNKVQAEDGNWQSERGIFWIFLWIATQFLLIALPEEYFYRGYLQTRLRQAMDARDREKGREPRRILGVTPAVIVASFLFGLGHLLVPIGGVLVAHRMSVFFPSLVFGWLRERTGNIGASVFYHACSNLMVLFAAVHFS